MPSSSYFSIYKTFYAGARVFGAEDLDKNWTTDKWSKASDLVRWGWNSTFSAASKAKLQFRPE